MREILLCPALTGRAHCHPRCADAGNAGRRAWAPKTGATMSYVVHVLIKSETDVGLIHIEALRTYWSNLANSQSGQINYSFTRTGNEIEFRFRDREAAYSFAQACVHYHNIDAPVRRKLQPQRSQPDDPPLPATLDGRRNRAVLYRTRPERSDARLRLLRR